MNVDQIIRIIDDKIIKPKISISNKNQFKKNDKVRLYLCEATNRELCSKCRKLPVVQCDSFETKINYHSILLCDRVREALQPISEIELYELFNDNKFILQIWPKLENKPEIEEFKENIRILEPYQKPSFCRQS